MKIKMIIHGRSNAKVKLQRLAQASIQAIEVVLTENANHTQALAKDCESYDLLISCGGDGTNNHIVNGLMTLDSDKRPALGFIPAGSGNDFARIFSSGSLEEMVNRCESKTFKQLDLIHLQHQSIETYALNMATCGIGAEIAHTVNARKFKLPGAFNYYTAIIAWLAKYSAPTLEIQYDDQSMESESFLTAIGNGAFAGNGLGLNPQSTVDDGLLGLTVIGNVGVIDFIKYQSTLKRCNYVQDPRVNYYKSKEVAINVLKGSLPIETDGEFFARLHPGDRLVAKILPAALTVV